MGDLEFTHGKLPACGDDAKKPERNCDILRAYQEGWTTREIAVAQSMTPQAVRTVLKDALAEIQAEQRELATEVLQLELQRLDLLLKVHMPKALEGDLDSFDRVIRIMDRRAKYLGLDAPEKFDVALTLEALVLAAHKPKEEPSGGS